MHTVDPTSGGWTLLGATGLPLSALPTGLAYDSGNSPLYGGDSGPPRIDLHR